MNTFEIALIKQGKRLAACKTALMPASDQHAAAAIKLTQLSQDFLVDHQHDKGFSEWHPAMVVQMATSMGSLELNQSLVQSRGNGRVATIVDHTKSSGAGMRSAADSLTEALNIQLDSVRDRRDESVTELEFDWQKDPVTGISYPLADKLTKSVHTFEALKSLLDQRRQVENEHRLSKKLRKQLLLTPHWTESKVIAYTIEMVARSFAKQVSPEVRHSLVRGNVGTSLEAAFKSLPFA